MKTLKTTRTKLIPCAPTIWHMAMVVEEGNGIGIGRDGSDFRLLLDVPTSVGVAEVEVGTDSLGGGAKNDQSPVDVDARDDLFLETGLRGQVVLEHGHTVPQGRDLGVEPIRVSCSDEAVSDVVCPQDVNTSPTQRAVDCGNGFSQEDLHERGLGDAATDSTMQRDQSVACLSGGARRNEEHSSFSSMQQLQLRAQILVYGDLVKGFLPEESLMSSAFSDGQEESGPEPRRSGEGLNWERAWQLSVDMKAEMGRQEAESLVQAVVNGKSERIALNGGSGNLGLGTPSTSPNGVAEGSLGEDPLPMVMSPASRIREILVSDLGGHTTDISEDSDLLPLGLDPGVTVAPIVNTINDVCMKESRFNSRRAESPSLDPWLKPHSSSLSPTPGSMCVRNPSSQTLSKAWESGRHWVSSPQKHYPVSGSPTLSGETLSPSGKYGVSCDVISISARNHGEGSLKRKGKGTGKVAPMSKGGGSTRESASTKIPRSTPGQIAAAEGALPMPQETTPNKVSEPTLGETVVPRGAECARLQTSAVKSALWKISPVKGNGLTRRQSQAKNIRVSLSASHMNCNGQLQLTAIPSLLFNDGVPAGLDLGENCQPIHHLMKTRKVEIRPSLHEETHNWLQQAKLSFEEAVDAANAAARQVHLVKSQIPSQGRASCKGSQRATATAAAAAAVNAAASVAKAAAEAAKVAYETALRAALITSDESETILERAIAINTQSDKDGVVGGRRSAIAAAKEEARKRAKAVRPCKLTPQNTDAVLRAAKLMAEAATQAVAVLAKGNSVPFIVPQSPLNKAIVRRGRPRKDNAPTKMAGGTQPVVKSPQKMRDVSGSLKKGACRKGKSLPDLGLGKKIVEKIQVESSKFLQEKQAQRGLHQSMASASNKTKILEIVEQDQILQGSLVEVMNDEEGLRGGWFSAKVLQIRTGKAFVQYDEILTDDGTSQLKEWFPLEGPVKGLGTERPGIRLISPNNMVREEGRRKRRRTAFGQKSWSIGDMVDAFVQDGWWEGVVRAVDDDDENKITVYFPGEGDTSVIKAWNLRPSLMWNDGRWERWRSCCPQPSQVMRVEYA